MQILSEIVKIRNGFSIRGKVNDDPNGTVHVIQMKDLEADYSRIGSNAYRIEVSKTVQKHLLKKGEILVLARGANNKALCYNGEYDFAVAASAFFVLSIEMKDLMPEFLAWYLNQSPVQRVFDKLSAGTMIRNLNIGHLRDLEIPMLPLEKQKRIVEVYQLWEREQELAKEILMKRNKLIEHYLLNQLKQEK